jgi:hypothetical protein
LPWRYLSLSHKPYIFRLFRAVFPVGRFFALPEDENCHQAGEKAMNLKDQSAFEAMELLRELKKYDDFDPTEYFNMAARSLIASHGLQAFTLADLALIKMRMAGDDAGYELWEEVRAAMVDYYADEEEAYPARRFATAH